eukprot:TRINITY_DN27487_c0_g1_i1.p1 TRINITY_DN27487_c0_g1~~TRINITY_DN27487_c0_g1_i1.p1  ORF type:complete len:187 (-),score=38.62 TRINITY_DN27487_c0_g1_i1:237-797(-)
MKIKETKEGKRQRRESKKLLLENIKKWGGKNKTPWWRRHPSADILDVHDGRPQIDQLKDLVNGDNFFDLFHLGEKLAYGSFGTIYETNHKISMNQYAVKVVQLQEARQHQLFLLINECRVLRITHHPNLMESLEIILQPEIETLYMVLEYCQAGSLAELYEGSQSSSSSSPRQILQSKCIRMNIFY